MKILNGQNPIGRLHRTLVLCLALMISPLLLIQCAVNQPEGNYIKDGKEYGKVRGAFRHKWWNYYERGLSFADGRFFNEAMVDLKEAVKMRGTDQRMARTYGMHFVDYFPHREIGILHYETGDFEMAEKELKLSISQFPSAKARYYLDRVRKELISKHAAKPVPPKLSLDISSSEIWLRDDPIIVSGSAADDSFVSSLSVGGRPVFMEGARKRLTFREELALPQGRHTIDIRATNLMGKTAEKTIIVHVDREGPQVTLSTASDGSGSIQVIGTVYDESQVVSLRINNADEAIKKAAEVKFTKKLPSTVKTLSLIAEDRLGNRTTADVMLSSGVGSQAGMVTAGLSSDRLASRLLAAVEDKAGPHIQLKDWSDSQEVYLEKIYLEGQIRDESAVVGIKVNQVPILRQKGQLVYFNHLIELKEGENLIGIETVDEAGNVSKKDVKVIRKVPEALQLAERMRVSVLPFDQKGEISPASLSYQENLTDSLVNQNRFQVVERDKLDLVLQEQKLSRTDLIDKSTAIRLGKLVATQAVITGSITESRTGIEIVGRMIDTETSQILATEDVYDEVKDLKATRQLSEGMAIKFHREFPLLGGIVLIRKGNDVFTDLGNDKIALHRRLIIYREDKIVHPVTGKVLGADAVILGHAQVTQVLPDMSKAEIVSGKPDDIKKMDLIITE